MYGKSFNLRRRKRQAAGRGCCPLGVVLLGVLAVLLQGCSGIRNEGLPAGLVSSADPEWGEYGCNLNLLRAFYTPPQTPEESNYFIDMEQGESLRNFAFAHGLKNNHALFVFLHGRAIETPAGLRYAFCPDQRNRDDSAVSGFPIRDIARILGPANASQIHNLVLASCNRENMLCPAELKAYFPNVTNITHAAPNTAAQASTFRHALIYHSRDIQFLYEMSDSFTLGVFDDSKNHKGNFKKAVPYIAELYLPGARRPFSTQTAGRELLDPPNPSG